MAERKVGGATREVGGYEGGIVEVFVTTRLSRSWSWLTRESTPRMHAYISQSLNSGNATKATSVSSR